MASELDTLAEEFDVNQQEQEKIYEEMNKVLAGSLGDSNDFFGSEVKDVPSGIFEAVRTNVILFVIVGTLILGIIAYTRVGRNSAMYTIQSLQVGVDVLAQGIIRETKKELTDKGEEISGLQAQLEEVRTKQLLFEEDISKRELAYQKELDLELQEKLAILEASLKSQSYSEDEINSKMRKEELILFDEHKRRLAIFTEELNSEFAQEREEFGTELSSLKLDINKRNREILQLEKDLRSRAEELSTQKQEVETELSQAREEFKGIEQAQENKQKELEGHSLQVASVIFLIEGSKFEEATDMIKMARTNLVKSAYISQGEIDIFEKSYLFMESAMNRIKLLEEEKEKIAQLNTSLLEQQERITELENSLVERVEEKEELNNKIQTLTQELSQQELEIQDVLDGSALQTDIKAKEEEIARLTKETKNLEIEIKHFEEGLNSVENISIIADYLRHRQERRDDQGTRQLIEKMIEKNEVYVSIISILERAIDPDGNLEVDF